MGEARTTLTPAQPTQNAAPRPALLFPMYVIHAAAQSPRLAQAEDRTGKTKKARHEAGLKEPLRIAAAGLVLGGTYLETFAIAPS